MKWGRPLARAGACVAAAACAFVLGTMAYGQLGGGSVFRPQTQPVDGFVVRRTTIASTVTATGQALSAQQLALSFPIAGKVKEVLVKEGDQVKAGDALVRLDTTDLELRVGQAEAQLAAQQARLKQMEQGPTPSDVSSARQSVAQALAGLAKAQSDLDKLKSPPAPADVAAAQQQVASAQAALQKAQADLDSLLHPSPADVAAAQQQVASAQATLLQAQNREQQACTADPSSSDCVLAQAQLQAAQQGLAAAQAKLDQLLHPSQQAVDSAGAAVRSAQANLTVAEARLDQLLHPSQQAVAAAQASVDSARAGLAAAQAKLNQLMHPSQQAVAAAQASVESARAGLAAAQAKLDSLEKGASQSDIQVAEANVASAQAAVDAAQAKLEQLLKGSTEADLAAQRAQVSQAEVAAKEAQMNLDAATLRAPFDGTVTGLSVAVGDEVSAGKTVATIFSPTAVLVQVSVGETDVVHLRAGQQASVNVDALPGLTFRGNVISVASSGQVQQGVASFPVLVALTDLSQDPSQRPSPGMTATVTITTEQHNDVLAIPSRAIRRQGGQQVVDVVLAGSLQVRPVTTGLSSGNMVEVTSGLLEGEVVVLPASTQPSGTATAGANAGPRGGGIFGGFGGPSAIVR